ncbi:MAG: hypothetical protein PHR83_00165 [Paludibacter sp.]|nr:hypothetical protein [Paludibacter sp.]
MKIRILTTMLLLSSISMYSQKQQFVSVNLSGMLATYSSFRPGYGIAYEEKLSKHHGYEFGLNYRSKTYTSIITINNNMYLTDGIESYLNLPVSYKFYSDIVNLSTGISFDCFVGGKYLTTVPTITLGTFDISPKLYVGWNFKIGKEISLAEKLILEPELQYNPVFNYGYSFYGATLKLKYKFSK